MEKKLPLAKPMIEAFSWQSTILAILQTDEQCEDWIYSNYVQMYSVRNLFYNYNNFTAEISFFYNLDGSWCFYECKTNPWLDYFKIQRKIVGEKWKSIVDFVIERIDSSEYVYIPIERKYISAYKGLVNSHTMLIYGYDMEKRTFFCADNFNRRYLFDMVSFDELELAFSGLKFENLKPEITNNYSDIFDISIFKKIAPSWNLSAYKFHLSKLINDIKEYLLFDGYGMAYRNNDRFVFGIECYDALITYMWDAYLNQSDWYDFRAFRAFADHKIVMLKRLDYLEKKDILAAVKNIHGIIRGLLMNSICS